MRHVRQTTAYLASKNASFLFGTDTPSSPTYGNLPGLNGYMEMQRLRKAGLSLAQIFRAATISNAQKFKIDAQVGTIEPGKVANLVLLERSPLENVEAYDSIVTVCSSGMASPSLDARIMQRLPFRTDVERLPLFGLGCAGGVLGLSRAAALAIAAPLSRVLFLDIELSTLTFRAHDRSKSNLVATALFGDGAAAAIITCRDDDQAARTAPRIGPSGEFTWPDTLDALGWEVADDGLKVVFSLDIPTMVRHQIRPVVDTFLRKHQLNIHEVDVFVCHPGGAKVLDSLEGAFGLERGTLKHSREALREHGNMSSATVLFILRAALDAGVKGRCLLTSMGPGFTLGMLILETA